MMHCEIRYLIEYNQSKADNALREDVSFRTLRIFITTNKIDHNRWHHQRSREILSIVKHCRQDSWQWRVVCCVAGITIAGRRETKLWMKHGCNSQDIGSRLDNYTTSREFSTDWSGLLNDRLLDPRVLSVCIHESNREFPCGVQCYKSRSYLDLWWRISLLHKRGSYNWKTSRCKRGSGFHINRELITED